MNSEDAAGGFVIGMALGALITITILAFIVTPNGQVYRLAIENGCGCYDSKTGKFQWINLQQSGGSSTKDALLPVPATSSQ